MSVWRLPAVTTCTSTVINFIRLNKINPLCSFTTLQIYIALPLNILSCHFYRFQFDNWKQFPWFSAWRSLEVSMVAVQWRNWDTLPLLPKSFYFRNDLLNFAETKKHTLDVLITFPGKHKWDLGSTFIITKGYKNN